MSGAKKHSSALMQNPNASPPYKSGAPIAQVLNTEEPSLQNPQSPNANLAASTTPFSGRLVDLLLDSPEPTLRQKKNEQQSIENRAVGGNGSVIQLPKLPQLPQKTTRRPRIPPLLQGLHQPPPLPPSDRLLPRITDAARSKGEKGYAGPVSDSLDVVEKSTSANTTTHGIEESAPENAQSSKSSQGLDKSRSKQGRKRRAWSERETKDLLVGVSRFGIGSWKKILQCPDYQFDRRTAVDLKDRFRVCCPGKGPVSRHAEKAETREEQHAVMSKSAPTSKSANEGDTHSSGSVTATLSIRKPAAKQTNPNSSVVPPKLADFGITAPFTNGTRRARRKFDAEDDKNLLKGFERYGPVWHSMRDDPELGFETRHSRDLRDRFRIRYPEKHVKAGHKPKSSREPSVRDQPPSIAAEIDQVSVTTPNRMPRASGEVKSGTSKVQMGGTQSSNKAVPSHTSATANSRPHELMPYIFNHLPDLGDDVDAYYGANDESSITLNRDILQWADANPLLSTFTPTRTYNQASTTDSAPHIFTPADDGLHIDPLATVKRPFTTFRMSDFSDTTTRSAYKPHSNPTRPTTTNAHLQIPHMSNDTYPDDSNTLGDIPRTPNLPTIVFPHVPAASARTTLHNLPTPADLLLGMDLERPIPQGFVATLEDAFGFVMPS